MQNFLYDHLLGSRLDSDRTFLILTDGSEISFKEFDRCVNRIANSLIDTGLGTSDRVTVQAGKSWQALALYIAVVKAGGVYQPLNTAYTANEIAYFLGDAEPRIVVCDPASAEALDAMADNAGAKLLTLDQRGAGSLMDLAGEASAAFESIARDAEDLAAILYTSGTTGRSKGAMLSHHNLTSNADVLSGLWGFTEDDVLLHALPVFHTHGLFVATNIALVAGSRMIFLNGFHTDEVIERLPVATAMMGVPTFYTRLLDDPNFDKDCTRNMRLFVSGSAPMLAETHVAFEKRTGHRILERYGMTETNMNTSNPLDGERRAGTVGHALPGVDLRVVDPETGDPVDTDTVGSVQVRGPNVFQGYWKMPEKTAEEFTDDGFFITGDLGKLSSDNYLTIVGRDKDLIISGGFNIYPKEIELVLDEIDGVGESAVIGIAHPDFGEGVVAVLTGDNAPDEAKIKELIRDDLARFKQPKKVFYIDELPRNTMGKVQKNILREQFKGCFEQ